MGGSINVTRDGSSAGGLSINVLNNLNFVINGDGTVSGTSGLNAVGVTNGKKLFWISIGGVSGIRDFEQQ